MSDPLDLAWRVLRSQRLRPIPHYDWPPRFRVGGAIHLVAVDCEGVIEIEARPWPADVTGKPIDLEPAELVERLWMQAKRAPIGPERGATDQLEFSQSG